MLFQYEDNREIMKIFDKGIETLRMQVACFDMSSVLIKPVQRILKYPLILNELLKVYYLDFRILLLCIKF